MSGKKLSRFLGNEKARTQVLSAIVVALLTLTAVTGFFVALPKQTSANPFTWNIYNIDTGNITGTGIRMAKMSNGSIGVVYEKEGNLYYAVSYDNGSTWVTEKVTTEHVWIRYYAGFAYNSTDVPYIVYVNDTDGDFSSGHREDESLKLAYKTSGSWTIETIYAADGVNQYYPSQSNLAFNSTDDAHPHITCVITDSGGYDLYHYGWNGTGYEQETIKSGTYVGRSNHIAIDSSDVIYVSFLYSNAYDWIMYSNSGGSWAPVCTWSDSGNSHMAGDMTINSTGTKLTAFMDEGLSDNIYFDYYDTAQHTDVLIDGPTDYFYEGNIISMDVNSTDGIWVAYYYQTDDNLKVAWSDDGASWTNEIVDSGNATNNNTVGKANDILIDGNYVYIAYLAGDDTHGVGGDRDLCIAVYSSGGGGTSLPSAPTGASATVYTNFDISFSGLDANSRITFPTAHTNDTSGDVVWANETSYGVLTVSNDGVQQINLSWTKGSGATNTVIRYATSDPGTWTLSTGTLLYNDTGTSLDHQYPCIAGTHYYYALWSWNSSGYSETYATCDAVTGNASVTNLTIHIEDVGSGTALVPKENFTLYGNASGSYASLGAFDATTGNITLTTTYAGLPLPIGDKLYFEFKATVGAGAQPDGTYYDKNAQTLDCEVTAER